MAKANEPKGKMIKVDPVNSKYTGVYYRLSSFGKTFYINYRKSEKPTWEKVGREEDGFTKTMARELRTERIRSTKLSVSPGKEKSHEKPEEKCSKYEAIDEWYYSDK